MRMWKKEADKSKRFQPVPQTAPAAQFLPYMNLKVSFSWIGLVIFALPMLVNIAYVMFFRQPEKRNRPQRSRIGWKSSSKSAASPICLQLRCL